MRAIVQAHYGPPDSLRLAEVPTPAIAGEEVLVRVRASSVNAQDWHILRGQPMLARVAFGLRAPRRRFPGTDLAGVIEAVGRGAELRPGDEVVGVCDGAFAELVAAHPSRLVSKPAGMTFEQAAAIPIAGLTALQAVRNHGDVQAGQRVFVDGAGGGVGTFVVQLARNRGAHVAAATGPDTLELVRALGAEEVVAHGQDVRSGPFDLVIDVGGFASLADQRHLVAPGGRVVGVGAGDAGSLQLITGLLGTALRSRVLGQRVETMLARVNRDDLALLVELAAAGEVVPVVDRTFELTEAADAIRYVHDGRARGKVVVSL